MSDLPNSKIDQLVSLSEGRTIGAYLSQSLLTQYCGYYFPLIVETESGLEFRKKEETKGLNQNLLQVSPNPVADESLILLPDQNNYIEELIVSTIDGVIIYQINSIDRSYKHALNTSQLSSGIYYISVKDNKGQNLYCRFIKK